MNKYLKLSVKAKLILLFSFPLIAFLVVAVLNISQHLHNANEGKRVSSLIEVTVKIGDLVHEMIIERSYSALVNIDKDLWQYQLSAQRSKTDDKITLLQQQLLKIDLSDFKTSTIKNLTEDLPTNIETFLAARPKLDRGELKKEALIFKSFNLLNK